MYCAIRTILTGAGRSLYPARSGINFIKRVAATSTIRIFSAPSLNMLPAEIVDLIFQFAVEREDNSKSLLLSLIRVCRIWRGAAERKLYQTINLGSVDRNDMEMKLSLSHKERFRRKQASNGVTRIAPLLCRSLQGAPRLSTHLVDLSIFLPYEDDGILECIKLLAECTSLQYLALQGTPPQNPSLLIDTLTKSVQLKGVMLQLHSPIAGYNLFKDGSQVVHLLRFWPKIESIWLGKGTIDTISAGYRELFPPEVITRPRYSFLPLKAFDIPTAWFMTANGLRDLRSLSLPNLTSFSVVIDDKDESDAALIDCLTTFGPRLEVFRLSRHPDPPFSWIWRSRYVQAIRQLISLKTMVIDAGLFVPEDLLYMPTLEAIGYRRIQRHALEVLVTGLESMYEGLHGRTVEHLPRLISLTLSGSIRDYEQRLRDVCSARQISFKFVRANSFDLMHI